jgi:hypothetical protein
MDVPQVPVLYFIVYLNCYNHSSRFDPMPFAGSPYICSAVLDKS